MRKEYEKSAAKIWSCPIGTAPFLWIMPLDNQAAVMYNVYVPAKQQGAERLHKYMDLRVLSGHYEGTIDTNGHRQTERIRTKTDVFSHETG